MTRRIPHSLRRIPSRIKRGSGTDGLPPSHAGRRGWETCFPVRVGGPRTAADELGVGFVGNFRKRSATRKVLLFDASPVAGGRFDGLLARERGVEGSTVWDGEKAMSIFEDEFISFACRKGVERKGVRKALAQLVSKF